MSTRGHDSLDPFIYVDRNIYDVFGQGIDSDGVYLGTVRSSGDMHGTHREWLPVTPDGLYLERQPTRRLASLSLQACHQQDNGQAPTSGSSQNVDEAARA